MWMHLGIFGFEILRVFDSIKCIFVCAFDFLVCVGICVL